MLCPEVWNFKAPSSTIQTKSLPLNDTVSIETTQKFNYSHLISTTLPFVSEAPESLVEALTADSDYYRIDNITLDAFTAPDFINSFIKNGKPYILSIDTRLDCDNSFCITPSGSLILNIDKTAYQTLGVEGTLSHYHPNPQSRYGDAFASARAHP